MMHMRARSTHMNNNQRPFVMTNGQRTKFGPGASRWQHDLQQANEQQCAAVATKLERWQKRSA